MAGLVVIEYNDMYTTEEARLKLKKMQQEYLVDLEDAVVAVKDEKGKVKLNQIHHLTAKGAVSGGFWGTLIGLIFLNPLLGMAAGATAGAASGALTDVGINDKFMKDIPVVSTTAHPHCLYGAVKQRRIKCLLSWRVAFNPATSPSKRMITGC